MIKEIVKDIDILQQVSEKFDRSKHAELEQDLLDTANAHIEDAVGLAAIQIGVPVKLIAVKKDNKFILFRNPKIVSRRGGTYWAKESCLSLEGERQVKRHNEVIMMYEDVNGRSKTIHARGYLAEVMQHECDHLKGILI